MTEEILEAAIMKLESRAKEQLAIIKDVYHRPAEVGTVDKIAQHALNLVQLEGAALTLRQYAPWLAKQTENEAISNAPVEPTVVEAEEDSEFEETDHEKLMRQSSTYREAMKKREMIEKMKANKDES